LFSISDSTQKLWNIICDCKFPSEEKNKKVSDSKGKTSWPVVMESNQFFEKENFENYLDPNIEGKTAKEINN
jgi:hypothetical protein